jgi:hypothetical protein
MRWARRGFPLDSATPESSCWKAAQTELETITTSLLANLIVF